MAEAQTIGFELSISGRNDGTLEAVYIQLGCSEVARTKEILEDVLLADYDKHGHLVGIEILAPVRIADLEKLVKHRDLQPFRRFVQTSAPRELVTA